MSTALPLACADATRQLGEPLAGTATPYGRWLLVERPGSWALDRLMDGVPPALLAKLGALSVEHGVQPQMIRRRRGRYAPERFTVYLASSTAPVPWLVRHEVDRLEEVLDLQLDALAADTPPGDAEPGPIYLACTHGQFDPCCARYGNPVAAAAAEVAGDRAWQSSHVGGCRFAGNLVSLPDGYVFGHLDADTAVAAVRARDNGELLLDHLRGRAGLPPAAQAAEALLRRELGLTVAAGVTTTPIAEHTAVVEHRTGAWRVTVRAEEGAARRAACSEAAPTSATIHRLAAVEVLA